MYIHKTKIRVRYAETDQMGVVHHSTYAIYYEQARTEALRNLGVSYREIEQKGIMLPVISLNVEYIRPAKYDDLLTIDTILSEVPSSKILFKYETYNEQQVCINKGVTVHAFINTQTNRPCRVPQWLLDLLIPIINKS